MKKDKLKFFHVVGTRPNFMKLSSVVKALDKKFINVILHTGQHYDTNMSDVFFKDLNLKKPNYQLNIGGGTQCEDIGNSLIEISKILEKEKPNGVIVYGDVTATLSGALASSKLRIPLIHVESGSRSFDREMPEEINRVLVDNISDILLCCDQESVVNLKNEGIKENVYLVGNTAIDTFKEVYNGIGVPLVNYDYVLCTLHRPFNVDDINKLENIIDSLSHVPYDIIFPVHPRTRNKLNNILNKPKNLKIINPLGYKEFINYLKYSKYVISDSGGVQSECASVKKRIFTLRPSTEHLLSINLGANILCKNIDDLKTMIENTSVLNYEIPMVWDGNSGNRIEKILENYFK
jgi:UDP-N-acetylglucosamine 2-epimerase